MVVGLVSTLTTLPKKYSLRSEITVRELVQILYQVSTKSPTIISDRREYGFKVTQVKWHIQGCKKLLQPMRVTVLRFRLEPYINLLN
jgi:hypothetical protein